MIIFKDNDNCRRKEERIVVCVQMGSQSELIPVSLLK